MSIAISLWFDPVLELALRDLWHELESAGFGSSLFDGRYRPHLTLGVWETTRLPELGRALGERLAQQRDFGIEFRSVGMFPGGVVSLAPVVTGHLLELHGVVHALAQELGTCDSARFGRDGWVAHCTMAWELPPDRVLQAAGLLLEKPWPLRGRVSAVGLIDTPAEVELRRFELPT